MAKTPFGNHVLETEIFSGKECAEILQKIMTARTDWYKRQGYFSMGAASYVDKENYFELVKEQNKNLLKHFSFKFYEDFKQKLESKFAGHHFQYKNEDGVGLPGFHIFPGKHDYFPFHFDLNHEIVQWPDPSKYDFSKTGSLTTVIKLPSVGGGIYVWPDWFSGKMPQEKIDAFLKQWNLSEGSFGPVTEREETLYREGSAYSFGNVLHQVIPELQREAAKEEFRITLQSHVLWHREGYWILYW